MKITPGSRIAGKSGKYLTVDRIEGDILHCGEVRVLLSAVVRVIPPNIVPTRQAGFRVGDRVEYIGSSLNQKAQYEGVLEVVKICPLSGYTCLTPRGRWSSWIEAADLRLVRGAQ
jgi:hypothetical protein